MERHRAISGGGCSAPRRRRPCFAACGQAGGTSPPGAASAAPVALRVTSWLVEQPSVEAYAKHLVEPFTQESPGTTITVEATAFAAYPEKLQAYGASGDLPDLLEVSYAWFPEWVKLGWLENLDAVIKRDRISAADYDRTVIGMGKWPYEKGPTYSWWTMMGIATFYYNKALFDREGQKYPDESWTWDQAVEVAKRLTRPGQQWGLHVGSYEASLLYAYGGSILNADATKCLLDQPGSIKAHQFWADLFLKHKVSGTSQEYRDAGATGDVFAAGKVGLYLHGSYQIGRYRQEIKDFPWDVAPLPKGPAGRAVLISGNPSHAPRRRRGSTRTAPGRSCAGGSPGRTPGRWSCRATPPPASPRGSGRRSRSRSRRPGASPSSPRARSSPASAPRPACATRTGTRSWRTRAAPSTRAACPPSKGSARPPSRSTASCRGRRRMAPAAWPPPWPSRPRLRRPPRGRALGRPGRVRGAGGGARRALAAVPAGRPRRLPAHGGASGAPAPGCTPCTCRTAGPGPVPAGRRRAGRALAATARNLRLAAALGAPLVVVHPSAEPIADAERAARLDGARRSLEALARVAAPAGVRVAVECLPRSCLGHTAAELLSLVGPLDAAAGVCLDVNHLNLREPDLARPWRRWRRAC